MDNMGGKITIIGAHFLTQIALNDRSWEVDLGGGEVVSMLK